VTEPLRQAGALRRPTLKGHILIARLDHWTKNVFVLPGIAAALFIDRAQLARLDIIKILIGLVAIGLIASSNYVINEVLDAPFDRKHPTKRHRPVPSGQVSIPWAYVQWIALMIAGLALGLMVSRIYALILLVLWIMGCLYNIPPFRTKDVPYLDVLSEAVNNPLRMLAGWYLVETTLLPPTTLTISYWMAGCYFMAIKRYAEMRDIGDAQVSANYRRSFGFYTQERLLVSISFYGACAMLFFGAFMMRYRLELILSFPLVAFVMSTYFAMAFKPDSGAQRPEALYRERWLMAAVVSCAVLMVTLLFVDVPMLYHVFEPTVPVQP
jgi:4-hydroxybenzoate polyprenyltransferase